MMRGALGFLALLAGLIASPASARPLFEESAPIEVTIRAPLKEYRTGSKASNEAFPATIEAGGLSHAITLGRRGKSRQQDDICDFVPLRVRFTQAPADGSIFHKQKSLKLVSHCRSGAKFQQHLLREYSAYRLYNVLTDRSLKVRLARINYHDGNDAKPDITSYGFFIEDIDDAAKRLDMKEIDVSGVRRDALSPSDSARYALFQYMIGNTDWSTRYGPEGEYCCHNSKLIGATKETRTGLIPVPYDFDMSGWVDAPYAVPNDSLPIRNVRQRLYRGYCVWNGELPAMLAAFRSQRAALEAEIEGVPGMDEKTKRALLSYLIGYFEDLATPDGLEKELVKDCR
ncbi:hypothetical protein [Sphingomicrobium flavum]|uniref:hypothetical protein n=1 Tax=Sphingomicrobium flavum TaxID=1229164 RepID=UPI0021AE272A|nr:hypothetical protein [Sphingomicrobium flavum]